MTPACGGFEQGSCGACEPTPTAADAEAAPQYEAELAARTQLDEAQTQLSEAKRKYEAS